MYVWDVNEDEGSKTFRISEGGGLHNPTGTEILRGWGLKQKTLCRGKVIFWNYTFQFIIIYLPVYYYFLIYLLPN